MACFGLSARLKQKFSRRTKVGQGNSKEVTINGSTKETSHQSSAPSSNGPVVSEKRFLSGRPRPRTSEPTVTTDDHVVPPSPPTGQDPLQPNDAVTPTTQIHDDHDVTDEISSPALHDEDVVEGSRTNEKAKITGAEYYATGYCGLCRTQLPHNYLPVLEKRTEEWEQWERDCRAVLCIDVENEAEHIVTDEFKLLDEDFESSVSATFNNHSIYTGLDIKLSVPGLDHNLAYIFHSWCYDILYWKQHNSSTINNPTTIYNLAKSLSHEASPWETIGTNADGWLDPPSRIETLIGDLNDDESAKWQPGFLSRLPAEIRAPIWGYVGMRSAYSSFFLVSRETSKLVGKVRMSGKRSLRIERGDVVRSGVTRFFGSDYVNVLENFGGGARDYKDVLIEEEVKSINVIAGLPGICALQFKGEDWESKWLGTVPNGGQVWYGTLENPGLAIDTIFTGLTCLDIKHKENTLVQLMWDRPDYPPHLTETHILQEEAMFLRWQTPTRTRFESMRYLPLFRGKEAATGLTFYCSDTGVIGMAAHFLTTTIYAGYRDGLPTYVPLEKGEHVRVMHYRLGINYEDCPGMVLETTKSRFHHIGTYMDPIVHAPRLRWCPFNAFTYARPIFGLSFQNPRREIYCAAVHGPQQNRTPITWSSNLAVKSYPTGNIPWMGFTRKEQEDMQDLGVDFEGRRYTPGHGLFFSCAPFTDLVNVQKCILGGRVVGLLLQYQEGSKKVLGQWYVENTYSKARNELVYDSKDHDGQCASFYEFCFEGDKARRVVVDVRFWGKTYGGVNKDEKWKWSGYCDTEEGMAWWYSKEYDHIEVWSGTSYEIPVESQVYF